VVDPELALRAADRRAVALRLRTGEDAIARVCVGTRPLPRGVTTGLWELRSNGCQSLSITGLRPLDLSLSVPEAASARVEVTTVLAAESNRSRKTVLRVAALR
jgi:hypothetical protein